VSDHIGQLVRASLAVIGSVTSPAPRGRSNPRHAKRSTSYPARPADPGKRAKPRRPLTLVMLLMPCQDDP
jgi:hypothetical protein